MVSTKLEFNKATIPNHVAIVMDGNGRWAQERGELRVQGHKQGVEAVRRTIKYCGEHGISVLTLFAFSSENWQRPKTEVQALRKLLFTSLTKEAQSLKENNVRLRVIGDLTPFGAKMQSLIEHTEKLTSNNQALEVVIAVNYGGRWDIVSACRRAAKMAVDGKLVPEEITEDVLSELTSLYPTADPDLVIRTGGEVRISNFLLWQAAYSELYFTDTLWPDFDDDCFDRAIDAFRARNRRFGRTREQIQHAGVGIDRSSSRAPD